MQPAVHGLCEEITESFLIFSISREGRGLLLMELPILADPRLIASEFHRGGGGNRTNFSIGCEIGGRKTVKPARRIVVGEREFSAREHDERFQNTGPGNIISGSKIIERTGS